MDIWFEQTEEGICLFGRYSWREKAEIQAVFQDWEMAKRVFPKARIK